jgi:hypothetical protein
MSLDISYGGAALPLEPFAVTRNRMREVADPLLLRITDFLAAVLNSELQAALDVLTGLPDNAQTVVVEAIPADPVKFLTNLSDKSFPILCCYRTQRNWIPWCIDQRKRETIWQVDYVLPELEPKQMADMIGFDNAVELAIAQAITDGHHSAYENDWDILEGTAVERMEPVESVSSMWTITGVDEKAIQYPATRVTFRTVELPTDEQEANPLESIGISQTLSSDDDPVDDLEDFVVSEVENLDTEQP